MSRLALTAGLAACLAALAPPAIAQDGELQALRKALLDHRLPLRPLDGGRARPDTVGAIDVTHVDIELTFDTDRLPDEIRFQISFIAQQDLDAVPLLAAFYEPLEVTGARANDFVHVPATGEFIVFLDRPLSAGQRGELDVLAALTYPCDTPPGCLRDAGYLHIADGGWYPLDLQFPFDDRFIARLDITTPPDLIASGTGRLVDLALGPARNRARYETERVTILPAFSIGPYTHTDHGLIDTFAPPGAPAGPAMALREYAATAVDFYEELFVPYPFSRLGMAAISPNTGAAIGPMANILLPDIFWFIDPDDPFLAGLVREVTSHEIGHQYFFNLVGVFDVGEAWMSEGFAEYASTRHSERWTTTRDNARSNYWTYIRQVPPDQDRPLWGAGVDQSPWYFELVYLKGSSALHALRHRVGTAPFDRAMSAFVAAFADQIVVTAEFETFMSEHLDLDLTAFFDTWIYGRGVVELRIAVTRGRTDDAPITLDIRQSGPPAPVTGPLPLRLATPDGATRRLDIPLQDSPIEIGLGDTQSIRIDPDLTLPRRVRPDPAGDVNLDGVVDGIDLLDVAFARGTRAIVDGPTGPAVDPDWIDQLDVDRDDAIDDADLDRLIQQFGRGW